MKIAIIYNKDFSNVINTFGMQNKEKYNPHTVQMVADALESCGHNVSIIDGNMHVIESLQNFMPKVMEGEKMGMVFNMAYGIQGESRYTHLPSMLEMLGIPYIGSTPAGHALALDKVITKIIMQKHGIPTPNFWVFNNGEENMDDVEYPVIVKPKMEAVSFGLKVVYNKEDLRDAVRFIVSEFQQQALVEQFIRGREFCVGLLGNSPVETFPVLEIDLEGDPDGIQTVDDKKAKPRQKICPAKISEEMAREMQKWSKDAFQALGLRDFARVDIRLDEKGKIYLLEINSMASLGKTGSYYHAAQVAGLDYTALVNKMLDVASVRYFSAASLPSNAEPGTMPLHVKTRSFLRGRYANYEKMLTRFVNTNTYVRNIDGVNKLGEYVKKELLSLRFHYNVYTQVEIGNILYFTNTDQPADILLIGNLDNSGKPSHHSYFEKSGQKLFGSGIWENKGGLVIMLGALQALRFAKIIRKVKIGILLTTDDSINGKASKELVDKLSISAKAVLGLHGAFLNGGVVTSRSGAAHYSLAMTLMDKSDAANVVGASKTFNKLLSDITALSAPEEGVLIAPGKSVFESNLTEPYAHGEAEISMRFNEKEQFEEMNGKLKKLIAGKKGKSLTDIHMDGGLRRPPMEKSERTDRIYRTMKSIADKLDIRLREEHRWSSSDICHVANESKLDGMGPIGTKPQDSGEYILEHSLIERMALLASTIWQLSKDLD